MNAKELERITAEELSRQQDLPLESCCECGKTISVSQEISRDIGGNAFHKACYLLITSGSDQ